jgi:uncharacterized CHY-type Zn-finger protein
MADNVAQGYTEINPYDEHRGLEWGTDNLYEPVICPRCDGTLFECVRSNQYETSLRCPKCKIQFVIHDG